MKTNTAKKILIVDDDYDIVEPLLLLFSEEGYELSSVTKGEQTYKEIDFFKPDLILLDILMSGSDGRTICRRLKAQKETKSIPVIMMSAHPAAKMDSKEVGADDFIAKPFEIDALLEVVRRCLPE